MLRTLVMGLIVTAAPLAAQQNSLVGHWKMNYPGGAKFENGVVTQIPATGMLTIEVQGDSLIGTLVTDPAPGVPARPPLHLAAVNHPDSAVFVSQSKGMMNINGEQHPIMSMSSWNLHAHGDQLDGTLSRQVIGMDAPPQGVLKVSGTRQKS
jgi:hypothetical protein